MKGKERSYLFYLEDMAESMTRILKYTESQTYEEFIENNLVIDAVVRNLEIIGEAANKIPDFFVKKYPEIPWKQMYGLRNLMIHEYFGIDYENIWKIISDELPGNLKDLEKCIQKEKKEINT